MAPLLSLFRTKVPVLRTKAPARSQSGNLAIITAIALVPIALVVTSGVELTMISKEKSHLQAAVDAGALAGATELSLASRGTEGVIETATAVANQAVGDGKLQANFTVEVDRAKGAVLVTGRIVRSPMIGMAGVGDTTLVASATAESLQSIPLCILQTKQKFSGRRLKSGLELMDTSSINAQGCLVHSNENINVGSSARIEATRVQAVGLASGTIMPVGNSGALEIKDPFLGMDLNAPTPCSSSASATKITVDRSDTMVLQPGVHCEQFKVQKSATLKLEPGEHYFFQDLTMKADSKLIGEDVVLIFGGTERFDFAERTSVKLSARRSGRFAGFLIATNQTNTASFSIASQNVDELLGTIYIPNADLIIESSGSVAEESAWSVIVARAITLRNNPKLVINTSYVASGVPVPEGVGPANSAPRLTK